MAQRQSHTRHIGTDITFHEGGEHASTHTPPGEPIPAKKKAEAAAGKFGAKAERQEQFRRNVLTGGR